MSLRRRLIVLIIISVTATILISHSQTLRKLLLAITDRSSASNLRVEAKIPLFEVKNSERLKGRYTSSTAPFTKQVNQRSVDQNKSVNKTASTFQEISAVKRDPVGNNSVKFQEPLINDMAADYRARGQRVLTTEKKQEKHLANKAAQNVSVKKPAKRTPTSDKIIKSNKTVVQHKPKPDERRLLAIPPAKVFESIRILVAFIGYPRSGHTLVSSLLDAHPHVCVANEYQIFQKWLGFGKKQQSRQFVFLELYKAAVSDSLTKGIRSVNATHPFSYTVPGEWNGKYDRYLQVIGDKHGPKSAKLLSDEEGKMLLTSMRKTLNISIRLIHVIRNPYDNIATMAIRATNKRSFISEGKVLDEPDNLWQQTRIYSKLLEDNTQLRAWFHVLDVHNSDLIAHAVETLDEICHYLHIQCSSQYLSHCASVVFSSPSKTRNNVKWTPKVRAAIEELIKTYPFLSRYGFDTN